MIELFDRLLSIHPKAERRTMFGCPTGFANGNLFLGLHEDRFFIRLSEDDRAAFVEQFGATFFAPIPGRKSRQTLVVPERVAAQPPLLRQWSEKAFAYALSLPVKRAKKRRTGARKKQAGSKLGAKRTRRGSRA